MSASTAKLLLCNAAPSLDVLGPTSSPVEALAAVHYFATAIERPPNVILQFIFETPNCRIETQQVGQHVTVLVWLH